MCSLGILGFILFLAQSSLQITTAQPQCDNIANEYRFDCYPESDATEGKCNNRGCCWKKPNVLSVPLDIPYCFYPMNYGYKLDSKEDTKFGYRLSLSRQGQGGPYGSDVEHLAVDVRLEEKSRLHFKIYDPANKRYEVPIRTPDIQTKSASLDYDVDFTDFPFGIVVTRKSTGTAVFNSSVGGMIFEDQFIQLSTLLPSLNLYGLGEHVEPLKLDVNWTLATLFSRDQGNPEGMTNLYGVHPFYLSLESDGNANGVLLLNSNAMDLVLQPTPALTYRTIGGVLDFYIFLGPSPDLVVQQYTAVIGRPFLPPYWGLGFHLCRWGYGSVNGTRAVNQKMRDYRIPQDVQWNDIDYMSKHLDFTADPNTFGDLGKFVDELHSKYNQHYIPIIDPGISNTQPAGQYPAYDEGLELGVFVNASDGKPIVGKVWPGNTVFPDFLASVTQDYWQKLIAKFHTQIPVDGLWIDMNEPSNEVDGSLTGCPDTKLNHPPYTTHVPGGNLNSRTVCMSAKHSDYFHYDVHSLYGYSETVSTVNALHNIRGKRTVVISRSSFVGSGQYGGHWTGDNNANWDDLYLSIPGILNFNLFGIPLVGSDICGFNGDTTKELCARWTQLGAFYPFSRNHNTIGAKSQDPAAFGDDFAKMAREVLLTRYTLLPYLYTLFAEAHVQGSAVARPLFYEFPKDPQTFSIDKQFLWGSALLITPVLKEGDTSVSGYFPDASWYDFYDGSLLQKSGSQYHTLSAPWDKINLHIHGGAIVPTQQPDITTTASRKKPFGLIVALSTEGEAHGSIFSDDGESLEPKTKSPYLEVSYVVLQNALKSNVSTSSYSVEAPLATVDVYGVEQDVKLVTVNGQSIKSFSFDSKTKVLKISELNLPMNKDFTIMWS